MKEIVFTLQFRGRGQAVEGTPDLRRARTTAAFEGDTATTEAEVRLTGPRSFVETGRIRYGTAGAITFRTIGEGVRGPSAFDGLVHGAVLWEVTGGEGRFAGATGLITSNFTVTASGDVVDDQVARLFIP
jgi:hypothetical protein